MRALDLDSIREGGKPALAAALTAIERADTPFAPTALLDAAYHAPRAHVIGLTGPPGVGKSTLMAALIAKWRAGGRTVGVIAVDPSSPRSGGALLGDRTRLAVDPADDGLFVRSMAARDKLGGLAPQTLSAMVLMRAIHDMVIVETVGVGQSETAVKSVVDSIILCLQPGAGDSLQFMKAGITEIPDIAVVTKSDLGAPAARALAQATRALVHDRAAGDGWTVGVLAISAESGEGIDALAGLIDDHGAWLDSDGRRLALRSDQAREWLRDWVRGEYGRRGARRAGDMRALAPGRSPFSRMAEIDGFLAALLPDE